MLIPALYPRILAVVHPFPPPITLCDQSHPKLAPRLRHRKNSLQSPVMAFPRRSVITHDSHVFIDESHDRIPADEPVVSPSLAPDSPISSVPHLESVFEISHEFRGDYTSNIYATSPEGVNFRGDIVTTTVHQAIKEVSH
ncbi:hypothetical protein OXX80_006445 [Metschnikowia pulcherrima]